MNTAEIPSLKEVFRDPNLGIVVVHLVGEKLVLHSQIFGDDRGPSRLGELRLVSDRIDAAFKRKGIERVYTWGVSDDQCRFNLFLGFKPTGFEVTGTGSPEPVYEFVKEL